MTWPVGTAGIPFTLLWPFTALGRDEHTIHHVEIRSEGRHIWAWQDGHRGRVSDSKVMSCWHGRGLNTWQMTRWPPTGRITFHSLRKDQCFITGFYNALLGGPYIRPSSLSQFQDHGGLHYLNIIMLSSVFIGPHLFYIGMSEQGFNNFSCRLLRVWFSRKTNFDISEVKGSVWCMKPEQNALQMILECKNRSFWDLD